MIANLNDIYSAIWSAAASRTSRPDVVRFTGSVEANAREMYGDLLSGAYVLKVHYDEMEIINVNGKRRKILCPDFYTLALQHLAVTKIAPLYAAVDPFVGLNCKKGCGVNAKSRKGSVIKRLKHIFYDCRDLNYNLVLDQRKCYDHITPKVFRRALKNITSDRELIDFCVNIAFVGRKFPIGTPTSPLAHHIIMLDHDLLMRRMTRHCVRYADANFLAFATKEEANAAKWRIINYWWYVYEIRAKRHTARIRPFTEPLDFCGYVFHRNPGKGVHDHNKGYVALRPAIARRAQTRPTDKSYPSYFGMAKQADCFGMLKHIEQRMNLKALTDKIKINRALDAPNITVKELADSGVVFAIHDYEIRYDEKSGAANWIKCLISFPSERRNGRREMREFHGDLTNIIKYHLMLEDAFGKGEFLPLTQVRMIFACGYIYEGSTNMITEIDDDEMYNN